MITSAPSRPAPPSAVQMPGLAAATPSGRRRVGVALAGLASAGAVLASVTPAQAETYYTGQCSVLSSSGTESYYRTFQARISGDIEQGTGKYIWRMYDYRYSVDVHLSSGASSDEQVTITSGYDSGLSNPWSSPDNHGSSGDWIQEGNWKNIKSYWGSTKVKFVAAFDVPGRPDPHCTATTAVV